MQSYKQYLCCFLLRKQIASSNKETICHFEQRYQILSENKEVKHNARLRFTAMTTHLSILLQSLPT